MSNNNKNKTPEDTATAANGADSAWSTVAKKEAKPRSTLQAAAAAGTPGKRNVNGGANRSKSFTVSRSNSNASHSNSNRRSSYTPQNSNNKLSGGGGGKNSSNKNRKGPGRSQSYSVGQQQQQHSKQQGGSSPKNKKKKNYKPKLLADITLLNTTGTGSTDREKTIVRFSADALLSQRMDHLDAPINDWTPHDRCLWKTTDRLDIIQQQQSLYYNFKPLAVNDETRWKPKAQQQQKQKKKEDDDNDEQERKMSSIQAILNKLSWTNLDKLTLQFVAVLQNNNKNNNNNNSNNSIPQDLVKTSMSLVVQTAMSEPHFAELYARLSTKLAAIHKAFKKTVLMLCQEQFEATGSGGSDDDDGNNNNENMTTTTATDSSSAQRAASRKKSIGLMKFIGELYVMKLIKAEIMMSCLERLLLHDADDDEEKLECFCKLMTTIGKKLGKDEETDDANQQQRHEHIWDQVHLLAGKRKPDDDNNNNNNNNSNGATVSTPPSTRIKFMLQALVELKENNWVQIRHEHEKAKTIAQLRKEVAREAKRGPITKTTSLRRSQSSGGGGGGMQQQQQSKKKGGSGKLAAAAAAEADADGFVTVAAPTGKVKRNSLRRVKSEGGAVAPLSSLQRASMTRTSSLADKMTTLSSHQEEYLEPKECGEKTKTILKEFFVGGDRDEAVLSISELVVADTIGSPGHVDRGAAVIEAGVLLVMEMKQVEVHKFLDVVSKCLDDNILDKASLVPGLNDPLEFLRDIEIDAPLASQLLAIIVADWLTKKVDDGATALASIEFLLDAPGFFRSDGRPAAFCAQILKERGGVTCAISDAEVDVVTKLMSDEDKKSHSSTRDFLQSVMK